MKTVGYRLLLPPVIFLAASLLAGCFSLPLPPAARTVDRDSPEFKSAVARESAAQQAAGKSAAKAEEIAVNKVTRATITAEMDRRSQQVAPLLKALPALRQPHIGCWAYAVTTTTRTAEATTVLVERFDPFQPEARLWTLVTRNGQAPDDREQADYRADRLRTWKREQNASESRVESQKVQTLELEARFSEFAVVGTDDGSSTYSFEFRPAAQPVEAGASGARSGSRETYRIDAAGRVAQHTRTNLGPSTSLGGVLQLAIWDTATDYTVLEPTQPPFITRTFVHYQGKFFGRDYPETTIEKVFSDCHRVKCYDDRFEVEIGEPTMRGFVP